MFFPKFRNDFSNQITQPLKALGQRSPHFLSCGGQTGQNFIWDCITKSQNFTITTKLTWISTRIMIEIAKNHLIIISLTELFYQMWGRPKSKSLWLPRGRIFKGGTRLLTCSTFLSILTKKVADLGWIRLIVAYRWKNWAFTEPGFITKNLLYRNLSDFWIRNQQNFYCRIVQLQAYIFLLWLKLSRFASKMFNSFTKRRRFPPILMIANERYQKVMQEFGLKFDFSYPEFRGPKGVKIIIIRKKLLR